MGKLGSSVRVILNKAYTIKDTRGKRKKVAVRVEAMKGNFTT